MANPNFRTPTTNLNFDFVTREFSDYASALDDALRSKITHMDPNNTKDMIEFQVLFNKYMVVEGLRSSIVKSIKDTLQSIIQKL